MAIWAAFSQELGAGPDELGDAVDALSHAGTPWTMDAGAPF